ncbi:MAG: hypothetical protein ACREM6_09180, partial [Vulcanimicrobiaceae bacterium]
NEDETGAISYANPHYWNSTGPSQPSQLWYDVRGHLLGADYSVLKNDSPNAPSRFGIARSRFHEVGAHIHYVVKNADGSFSYSKAVGVKRYAATGLDAQHPTAAGLVRLGVVSSPAQVATVFLLPATWDVSVWVLPNPAGAFADANPLIKPSKSAEERPM